MTKSASFSYPADDVIEGRVAVIAPDNLLQVASRTIEVAQGGVYQQVQRVPHAFIGRVDRVQDLVARRVQSLADIVSRVRLLALSRHANPLCPSSDALSPRTRAARYATPATELPAQAEVGVTP